MHWESGLSIIVSFPASASCARCPQCSDPNFFSAYFVCTEVLCTNPTSQSLCVRCLTLPLCSNNRTAVMDLCVQNRRCSHSRKSSLTGTAITTALVCKAGSLRAIPVPGAKFRVTQLAASQSCNFPAHSTPRDLLSHYTLTSLQT
jgi:hypothetical protein